VEAESERQLADPPATWQEHWGEYVHFTSGAAAADMSGQAARAFGWPREWAGQLEHARAHFPGIT